MSVPKPDPRGFTDWEHEPDEFDYMFDDRERDALDDADDDDLEKWLGDRR